MGQAESSPPLVEVQYDKLTYEELTKETRKSMMGADRNTPSGPIARVGMDLFGAVLLYFGTFVVCDLIRSISTGRWTHLIWSVLGPWNYFTGSPLLHRVTHIFDHVGGNKLQRCEEKYSAALRKCDAEYVLGGLGEGGQCHADATAAYQACYENSSECQQCVDTKTAEYSGQELCYNNPYVEGGKTCYPVTPPSQTEIEIQCLGELGYDPQ